uniref:Protein kinase domain-containing protein n=1 Tax=Nothobranchius furzeri TaxID=105023 RepID=A0A8C6NVL5_NOTFU
MPHKTSLDTGWRVEHFFKKCVKGSTITWELKTPQEYKIEHNKRSTPTVPKTKPLAELLGQEQLKPDTTKFRDFLSMIDLFKRMLTMEAADRITPDDALNHSFITMENLPDASESPYVKFGKEVLARSERARSERASPARVREMEEDSDQSELSGQVKQSTFTLEKGVQLIHGSNIYQVEEVIGSSANGIVVKCIEEDTDEKFAVKVFKKEKHLKAINEANVHNHFSIVNTDNNNLITMIDCFIHNGHFCLAFELLQLNLCDFVHQQHWKPMRVADIRPIAQQMLVSLSTLKYNGVIHADIKPSSVMLVNHDSQPFKVKLIGFGSAHETGTLTNITKVQTVGYRAPEVHMGLPFNESIDIWGLGCTLVFLYLAKHLFPEDEYSVMRLIHLRSLDNLVTMTSDLEMLNPSDRIRPDEALKHPFILRGKYPNTSCHPSVKTAV